jgi:hypothetical protein
MLIRHIYFKKVLYKKGRIIPALYNVKERAKFTNFGKKERPIFTSENHYFIDFITPDALINWQNRRQMWKKFDAVLHRWGDAGHWVAGLVVRLHSRKYKLQKMTEFF